MPCECGDADECDGENAVYYPLQDGGMCSVRSCSAPPRTSGYVQLIDGPKPRSLEWEDETPNAYMSRARDGA